ncbi:aldehyde dehydrogenase family protein, partial [Micromonospora sp. NPDC049559]|uniref:aldehyde dehydrogenase family protein n=1 Tax=Micromonospora sp. NPDC049559 TaxID=3155923 RepID=UPI0034400AA3
MTSVRVPGLPVIEAGELISTHPATGVEVGRFPVATRADVERAVERGAEAGRWWEGLGFAERRRRLLRWRAVLARRIEELADLSHREGGKPVAEAIVETAGAIEHIDWAARNARRVLGPRRVPSRLVVAEFAGRLEYRPYGVVGVISPWNYPVKGPIATVAYALAAGNAVVLKPSEYTPAVGQWLVDTFTELVDNQPVLQAVH